VQRFIYSGAFFGVYGQAVDSARDTSFGNARPRVRLVSYATVDKPVDKPVEKWFTSRAMAA
jgi:hypothetical protein